MQEGRAVVPISEGAELSGVTRRAIDKWIAAGKLTSVKFPRDRKTYIDLAQLRGVLAEEPPPRGRARGWRKKPDAPTPSQETT